LPEEFFGEEELWDFQLKMEKDRNSFEKKRM
jgi:hypothetical protein